MHLIVQYEDRPLGVFEPLVSRNADYAARFGMHHWLCRRGYEQYPPWWRKVFLVREMLRHYDSVMWVDTDAAIVGSFRFDELFEERHFVLSPNPPMLDSESLSMLSAPFCAGVWAVRNTPQGVAIMDRWAGLYDPSMWRFDGEWRHLQGLYAGIAYEQGAFEMGVWRCADFVDWIRDYPAHVLNHLPKEDHKVRGKHCPADVFAVHYWKGNRNHISQHWRGSAFLSASVT